MVIRRFLLHFAISIIAISLGCINHFWMKFDATTTVFMLIAMLPWLAQIFSKIKLPGVEVIARDIGRVQEKATEAGMLKTPKADRPQPSYMALIDEAPAVALAGLRIDIENRVRSLVSESGGEVERVQTAKLLKILDTKQILTADEVGTLRELMGVLNQAVYGGKVSRTEAASAIDLGRRIIASLDDRFRDSVSGVKRADI